MNRKVITVLGLTTLIITSISNTLSLAKTSTISYQTYKEGNTDNLVLNKILSDNELKQEIPHMFNYASNGNYWPISSDNELNDPNYVTNGLYSSEDEDGTTYYYRGDIDNNNIVFGTYDEDYYVYEITRGEGSNLYYYQSKESCLEDGNSEDSCVKTKLASKGDKMYWKIVRVNGDGSLRLIYNGPGIKEIYTAVSFNNDEISGVVGAGPYNLDDNVHKYTGYTYDKGTDSFIKKEVDTWYNNTLGSNSSYDSKVIEGRFCSDSSGYRYDETFEVNIFSSFDRLGQVQNNFAKDNAPTFICPNTSESYGGSYRLKAGLITADELVYAGESVGITGNSYLNPGKAGLYYWSMTPSGYDNVSFNFAMGNFPIDNMFSSDNVSKKSGIRPVINITTENMTLTGDGTIENPYILEEVNTNNSYKGKVTIEVGSSVDDIKAFEENLDLSNVTWTVKDSSIAKIESGKIIGLKEGTVIITGVGSDGTTYEIEVTVISNPTTNSAIYIGIGLILILILGTCTYIFYRVKRLD